MMISFCCNVLVWMDLMVSGGDEGNKDSSSDGKNVNLLSVYVVMCLIIVGALVIVIVGFCLFHLFLLCKGKTTR